MEHSSGSRNVGPPFQHCLFCTPGDVTASVGRRRPGFVLRSCLGVAAAGTMRNLQKLLGHCAH
ncbi:Hypothetical protein SMAX5B_008752 [Scophthalmus maximus]|uniref:Uncharacterized protein n=1 Tax=Scophthalmus maximus TaxID=52904 RepID=A0A2U9CCV8_SCOMX|nr:Hypothetical protein SMAX5B_008752 [Scophthalmus maximus]